MSERFKPCPFCGETLRMRAYPAHSGGSAVCCDECGAVGPTSEAACDTGDAGRLWNNRSAEES